MIRSPARNPLCVAIEPVCTALTTAGAQIRGKLDSMNIETSSFHLPLKGRTRSGKADRPGEVAFCPEAAAIHETAQPPQTQSKRDAGSNHVANGQRGQVLLDYERDNGQRTADDRSVDDQPPLRQIDHRQQRLARGATREIAPVLDDIKQPRAGDAPHEGPKCKRKHNLRMNANLAATMDRQSARRRDRQHEHRAVAANRQTLRGHDGRDYDPDRQSQHEQDRQRAARFGIKSMTRNAYRQKDCRRDCPERQ